MPVYVRKNLLSITPESLGDRSSDDEDYIRDPEQMYDVLPQPFRFVNKIVNLTFDLAWEIISRKDAVRIAERSHIKPPQYDCAVPLPDYRQALCMTDSPDGRYVFLGLPHGITVIDAMTQSPIASWDHGVDSASIYSLSVCLIGVQIYLIAAIDTVGTGRLLCCAFDAIHPIKIFNEDVSGCLVTTMSLSKDGDYVAVAIKNGVEVWLDVWHLPRDNWLRELETAHANAMKQQQLQQQAKPVEAEKMESSIEMASSIEGITTDNMGKVLLGMGKSNIVSSPAGSPTPHPGGPTSSAPSLNMAQMSKPNTVLRVRPPPSTLTGISGSASSAFRAIDEGHVVGLGTKQHLISEQHLEKRRQAVRQQHRGDKLSEQDCPQPLCVFLNPSFMLVTGQESSNDRPNSVAVAWMGSTNVCHYNLIKPSKDLEHKPDIVWPFGSSITCLAVSPCTSLLAVGHQDGTLAVYDHHMGLPQAVHRLSSLGAVSHVVFLNPSILPPRSRDHHTGPFIDPFATPDTYLMAHCATDGSVSVVRCGYEAASVVRVVEPASNDPTEKIISVQTLTGIPQVVVVVRGSGEVSLVDIHKGHALCTVALRASDCKLTAVVPPVLTPAANAHMLYVKGVKEYLSETGDDTDMFVFPLRSFPALEPYLGNPAEPQPYSMHVTVQKRFDLLLSKRLSQQNERQQRMQQRWHQLTPQVISCKQ